MVTDGRNVRKLKSNTGTVGAKFLCVSEGQDEGCQ